MLIITRLWYNNSMRIRSYRDGFTLIEISLSLVFVTILALAITLIISNTIGAYQRGLILNQVNTLGMSLVDDFRLALQNSSGKTLTSTCAIVYKNPVERANCEADEAFNFVSVTKYTTVKVKKRASTYNTYSHIPIYGAFCTGSYSYIWNSGYFDSPDAEFSGKSDSWARLTYKKADGSVETIGNDEPFKLLKVRDTTRAVCVAAINPNYDSTETESRKYAIPDGGISYTFDISKIGDGMLLEAPEYLISSNTEGNLTLYELLIVRPALSTEDNSLFYSGSFILGTVGGGIDIMANGKTCATPNDYEIENFDYCAINKFNFAVQASGE